MEFKLDFITVPLFLVVFVLLVLIGTVWWLALLVVVALMIPLKIFENYGYDDKDEK